MPAELIRCPGCGAADTSVADPKGLHTCVYCGVRYQIQRGTPHTVAPGASAGRSNAPFALLGGVVGLAAVAGAAGYFLLSAPGPAPRAAAPTFLSAAAPAHATAPAPSIPSAAAGDDERTPAASSASKTVSVAAPIEETAPATADFTLESQRVSGGALWIYGFITNTSPFTLGKPKVTVVLLDAGGAEVGTGRGYAEFDVVAAGERTPIKILITDPPAHERLQFEVHVERPSYLPTLAEGLELEAGEPRRHTFLGWKVAGKVHNKGASAAHFVRIDVLAFDADDKFAAHGFTYTDDKILAAGASARFEAMLLDSETDLRRFELHLTGKPAD